ncbi:MAG: ABC-F family ATP-binding cassette domain-containing protein [Bacteroidales bacterium]|jgi:ATP-binding cassette subfamily F protein 3|nr:ABC-F family ATP-binding cassette domain-containing protein [Bacteroidales bacterium]
MITVNNLSVRFSGKDLFKNINFVAGDKEHIALSGKNGAGKSTLLNVLAGNLSPQTGNIVITKDFKIGYLPQEKKLHSPKTVWAETMTAFVEIQQMENQIAQITHEISQRTDYQSNEYNHLLNQLSDYNHRLSILDAGSMDANTEQVLTGLGFERTDFERNVSEFSSGWQMRIELAKILLRKTEILLLDEPTNHLDIESIQWLERFLATYSGTLLLVSHDKRFLDTTCRRTMEISLGGLQDYNCNYSQYVIRRAERIESQLHASENQKKEIAETEKFIERFRYKATKAKQVQSRIKLLEKMEKTEVEQIDTSHIHFRFLKAPACERVVFEAQNLSKSYSQLPVLEKINFVIQRKEKIVFVGKNGEGKTTLVRILKGELTPTCGTLLKGEQVKIGYYAQEQNGLLDDQLTVFQTIDNIAVGDMRLKTRSILGSFLFSGDDIEKKVSVLSGGEKARLALAKLLLEPYNVLILDEPTNHLDMTSKEILKNALQQYDGTLILVSHDRDFLQGLSDKVFEFKNHNIKTYLGDINYYLEKKESENQSITLQQTSSIPTFSDKNTASKLSYEQQKQIDAQQRKKQKQIQQLEAQIQQLEQHLQHLSTQLADETTYQNADLSAKICQEYDLCRSQLADAMQEWTLLVES